MACEKVLEAKRQIEKQIKNLQKKSAAQKKKNAGTRPSLLPHRSESGQSATYLSCIQI
jgi:hypothetical protein